MLHSGRWLKVKPPLQAQLLDLLHHSGHQRQGHCQHHPKHQQWECHLLHRSGRWHHALLLLHHLLLHHLLPHHLLLQTGPQAHSSGRQHKEQAQHLLPLDTLQWLSLHSHNLCQALPLQLRLFQHRLLHSGHQHQVQAMHFWHQQLVEPLQLHNGHQHLAPAQHLLHLHQQLQLLHQWRLHAGHQRQAQAQPLLHQLELLQHPLLRNGHQHKLQSRHPQHLPLPNGHQQLPQRYLRLLRPNGLMV